MYKIKRLLREAMYNLRYFFQKLFRKGHFSDFEVIELHYHIAEFILPRLKNYRDRGQSYPSIFVDYDESYGMSKEEYEKKRTEGLTIGGGLKAWQEILDKMILSFQITLDLDDLSIVDFKRKYDLDWNSPEVHNIRKEGLYKFAEYFADLWL